MGEHIDAAIAERIEEHQFYDAVLSMQTVCGLAIAIHQSLIARNRHIPGMDPAVREQRNKLLDITIKLMKAELKRNLPEALKAAQLWSGHDG